MIFKKFKIIVVTYIKKRQIASLELLRNHLIGLKIKPNKLRL
jgi:hypothetical protein